MADFFDHPDEIDTEIRRELSAGQTDQSTVPASAFFARMPAKGLLEIRAPIADARSARAPESDEEPWPDGEASGLA